jgi:hypothetical protein
MRQPRRNILQAAFLILFALLLIRFFLFVVRVGEAAALGLWEFWWGILILAMAVWLLWAFRKRRAL